MPKDLHGSRQWQRWHDSCDNHVGKPGAGHPEGGEQHGVVAQHVIAGTHPNRPHVGVAGPVRPQEGQGAAVGKDGTATTAPMTMASGSTPWTACQTVEPTAQALITTTVESP